MTEGWGIIKHHISLASDYRKLLSADNSSVSFQATRKANSEEVKLDIYLMNGNKFTVDVFSTDETDEVLEVIPIL